MSEQENMTAQNCLKNALRVKPTKSFGLQTKGKFQEKQEEQDKYGKSGLGNMSHRRKNMG
jgi:hypothetical protein